MGRYENFELPNYYSASGMSSWNHISLIAKVGADSWTSFRKADMTESCLGASIPRPKELMSYSSLAVMPNSDALVTWLCPLEPGELPPVESLLCKDGNGIRIRC